MFDDPKKELQRLEQQLLAAQRRNEPQQPEYEDELYDEQADREPERMLDYDAFEADDSEALRRAKRERMESRRYVPVAKKKGIGRLLAVVFFELVIIALLLLWWARYLL